MTANLASLKSPDPLTDTEKQILCVALAAGSTALDHWLIWQQGPRLIELAGSIVIQMTKSAGEAAAGLSSGVGNAVGGAAQGIGQAAPFLLLSGA